MLLKDFINEAVRSLTENYPAPEAGKIVERLCEDILGVKSYTHIIEPEYQIPEGKCKVLQEFLSRLCANEPIQYVLGKADFCGYSFNVCPGVLIPRPETEFIVQEAMKLSPRVVLDLCTGSGCIAWAVTLGLPGVKVTGVDISEKALAVARGQNFCNIMEKNGSIAPVFVRADIHNPVPAELQRSCDVILSNPPYIMGKEKSGMRENVLGYEPHSALFVPDDDPLLFYRSIARWASELLRPGGTCIVEANELLCDRTASLFSDAGFRSVLVHKDIFLKNRFISFIK